MLQEAGLGCEPADEKLLGLGTNEPPDSKIKSHVFLSQPSPPIADMPLSRRKAGGNGESFLSLPEPEVSPCLDVWLIDVLAVEICLTLLPNTERGETGHFRAACSGIKRGTRCWASPRRR